MATVAVDCTGRVSGFGNFGRRARVSEESGDAPRNVFGEFADTKIARRTPGEGDWLFCSHVCWLLPVDTSSALSEM